MIKKSGLFLGLALVVLSLTFAGCTEKKAGKEMAPEAAEEAPAAEMAEDMEEAPMAPAEGEEAPAAEMAEDMEEAPMAPAEGEEGE